MKKTIALALCLMLLLPAVLMQASAAPAPSITLDGARLPLAPAPYIESGRMMAPLSAMAEALGAEIDINIMEDGAQIIYVDKDMWSLGLIIGVNVALANNQEIQVDVSPIIIGDEIFVPIRLLCETLGFNVEWEAATKTASVTERLIVSTLPDKLEDDPFSILGGRLTVRLPQIAESGGIGDAEDPQAGVGESWLMLYADEQELVLDVKELYVNAGNDFEAAAGKILGEDMSLVSVEKKNGLSIAKYVPADSSLMNGYALILGALVLCPDNMIANASVYVNSEAFLSRDACAKIAGDIMDSLSAGTKKLETGARTLSMSLDRLSARLPEGFGVSYDSTPDYEVYNINKILQAGETPVSMSVYISSRPLLEEPQTGVASKIDGRDVIWRYTGSDVGVSTYETTIDAMFSLSETTGEFVHILVYPSDEKNASEFIKIAESITIKS